MIFIEIPLVFICKKFPLKENVYSLTKFEGILWERKIFLKEVVFCKIDCVIKGRLKEGGVEGIVRYEFGGIEEEWARMEEFEYELELFCVGAYWLGVWFLAL